MAIYEYGAPNPAPVRVSTPSAVSERPRCWGKSFDETDRECRGCGFQNSCKDELIRNNVNRPRGAMAAPAYYAPQPVRPYATPQAVHPLQQPVTSYPYHQPVAPPASNVMTVAKALSPMMGPPQLQPTPQAHRYGWLQDPLYWTIHSAPPPMRVQMDGETFLERVVKNAALAMLEKGAAECFLAIRQMLLAPAPGPVRTVDYITPAPGLGQRK